MEKPSIQTTKTNQAVTCFSSKQKDKPLLTKLTKI